jgi:hypothetical protein
MKSDDLNGEAIINEDLVLSSDGAEIKDRSSTNARIDNPSLSAKSLCFLQWED